MCVIQYRTDLGPRFSREGQPIMTDVRFLLARTRLTPPKRIEVNLDTILLLSHVTHLNSFTKRVEDIVIDLLNAAITHELAWHIVEEKTEGHPELQDDPIFKLLAPEVVEVLQRKTVYL